MGVKEDRQSDQQAKEINGQEARTATQPKLAVLHFIAIKARVICVGQQKSRGDKKIAHAGGGAHQAAPPRGMMIPVHEVIHGDAKSGEKANGG